jgi:hypothetical protein
VQAAGLVAAVLLAQLVALVITGSDWLVGTLVASGLVGGA